MGKTEMEKVINWLDRNNIKYEHIVRDAPKGTFLNRNQLLIETNNPYIPRLSVICHYGSYGYERGLLELYDFEHETEGYLTAQQCIELIKKGVKKDETK